MVACHKVSDAVASLRLQEISLHQKKINTIHLGATCLSNPIFFLTDTSRVG